MQQQLQPQFTFEGGHLVMYHQEQTGLPQMVDSNVNDRDRTFDLLLQEKHLCTEYNIAMGEASHDQLHQVFHNCHMACHQAHRRLFDVAFKKGWYRLPVADAQSVVSAFNKMQQRRSEFPMGTQLQGQWQSAQPSQSSQPGQNWQAQPVQPWQIAQMQSTSGSIGQQQLNQKVDQALSQVEQGKLPSQTGALRSH